MKAYNILWLTFVLTLLVVPMVSAFEFDNVKQFNELSGKYGKITIRDSIFGIPTTKVAEYTLLKNSDYCINNCFAEGTATLYEEGELFRDVKLMNRGGEEEAINSLDIYVKVNQSFSREVNEYSDPCDSSKMYETCNQKKTGTKNITWSEEGWATYNYNSLPTGDYEWRIEGKKNFAQSIDWIPLSFGEELNEWAWWSDNFTSCQNLTHTFPESSRAFTTAEANFSIGTGSAVLQYNWEGSAGDIWSVYYNDLSDFVLVNRSCDDDSANEVDFDVRFNSSEAPESDGVFIFFDSYDWENLGTEPALPTVVKTTGTFTTNNTINLVSNTNQSVRMNVAGGSDPTASYALGSRTDNTYHKYWIRQSATNLQQQIFVGLNNGLEVYALQLDTAGNFRLFRNGGSTALGAYAADTWYLVEVFVNFGTTNFDITIKNIDGSINQQAFNQNFWSDIVASYNTFIYTPSSGGLINFMEDSSFDTNNWTAFNSSILTSFGAVQLNVLLTSSLDLPVNATNVSTALNSFWCNQTASALVLNNVTFNLWNETANVLQETQDISGTDNRTNFNATLPHDGDFLWNCFVTDTTTFTDWGDNNFTISLDSSDPIVTVDLPTGDNIWTNGTLDLNFTVTDLNLDSCWFSQNSGTTNTSISGCANTTLQSHSLNLTTVTVYANDTGGLEGFGTTTYTSLPILSLCNSTSTQNFLNLTFKNEVGSAALNASIDASTFNYFGGSSSTKIQSLVFSNTTDNAEYSFCSLPAFAHLTTDAVVKYSGSTGATYPQRTYDPSIFALTNISKEVTLWLLDSTVGQFVTFQVVNQALTPLNNVSITATRVIGSSTETIEIDFTDAAGGATMWLNPNFAHTFQFSKSGFTTLNTVITPTQTAYTITLSAIGAINITDSGVGIVTTVAPSLSTLDNNTDYTFNLTLNSSSITVENFGYTLKNASGFIFRGNSSATNGGFLSTIMNTGTVNSTEISNRTIIMEVFWTVEGVNQTFSRTWTVADTGGTGFSLSNLGTDIKTFLGQGIFGLTDFGLAILVFLFIFFTTGLFAFKFGLSSPAALSGIIFAQTAFFDVGLGLVPTPIGAVPFFATFFIGLIALALAFREFTTL